MDQNYKENIVNPESQMPPEVVPVPSNSEAETTPEDFSLEVGDRPNSAPVAADQIVGDSQVPPQEETEEEIQQQVGDISHLPEEEKLDHLKNVAEKNSLEKAIRMVKKMDSPWLEDRFHDDLMDDPEWRKKLEELGKIERL